MIHRAQATYTYGIAELRVWGQARSTIKPECLDSAWNAANDNTMSLKDAPVKLINSLQPDPGFEYDMEIEDNEIEGELNRWYGTFTIRKKKTYTYDVLSRKIPVRCRKETCLERQGYNELIDEVRQLHQKALTLAYDKRGREVARLHHILGKQINFVYFRCHLDFPGMIEIQIKELGGYWETKQWGGEDNPNAKLSKEQVMWILENCGILSSTEIAKQLNNIVTPRHIRRICSGDRWQEFQRTDEFIPVSV